MTDHQNAAFDTERKRITGLRNLRTAYSLAAAVGFWKEIEGEDLIEEYAKAVDQLDGATIALQRIAFANPDDPAGIAQDALQGMGYIEMRTA